MSHNIIKFDLPALKKVYDFNYKGKLRDTLVLTRLIWSDIKERDFQTKDFPTKLIGRHSLQAWGVRLETLRETTQDLGTNLMMRCYHMYPRCSCY